MKDHEISMSNAAVYFHLVLNLNYTSFNEISLIMNTRTANQAASQHHQFAAGTTWVFDRTPSVSNGSNYANDHNRSHSRNNNNTAHPHPHLLIDSDSSNIDKFLEDFSQDVDVFPEVSESVKSS